MEGKDWHEWRRQGIGASDAPAIMGVSPWTTPYQLWEIKTGLNKKTDEGNWATRHGNRMEPQARADYELRHNLDMPARLVEHAKIPWLRASLDGYSADGETVLEIKCPGAEDHAKAEAGIVPEKYIPQVQHQLMVTGAKRVHYYSFLDGQGALVEVLPDIEFCKKLFALEKAFWDLVVKREPPELIARDYKKIRSIEASKLAEEWKVAKEVHDKSVDILERAKAAFLDAVEIEKNRRVVCGTVRVAMVPRKGNVDYKKVPELKGVDLEKYRAATSVSARMTVIEGETTEDFVL